MNNRPLPIILLACWRPELLQRTHDRRTCRKSIRSSCPRTKGTCSTLSWNPCPAQVGQMSVWHLSFSCIVRSPAHKRSGYAQWLMPVRPMESRPILLLRWLGGLLSCGVHGPGRGHSRILIVISAFLTSSDWHLAAALDRHSPSTVSLLFGANATQHFKMIGLTVESANS